MPVLFLASRSTMNFSWMGGMNSGEMGLEEEEVRSVVQGNAHALSTVHPNYSLLQPQIHSAQTPKAYQSTLTKVKSTYHPGASLAAPELISRRNSGSSTEMPITSHGKLASSPIPCPGQLPSSVDAIDQSCMERGMLHKSRNWRHRSMPNLFEPGKKALTVSPTTSITLSQTPPGVRSFICTEALTGLDMDQDATSELTLDDSHEVEPRRKTLVRKQLSTTDGDSSSHSPASSTSSSVRPNHTRKRGLRRGSMVKRRKPNDSCCFLVDADLDESISSAGELERFFDSMGLEEQSKTRTLQIQVSDDAMESQDEEEFESVSIVGVATRGTTDFIPSVETDDDEPVPDSHSTTKSAATAPLIGQAVAAPKPPGENVVLRNARIYKWLVNCRSGHP